MITNKSIKRNFAINLLKNFFQLLFPIITFPYVSRILLPVGMGRISFSQSIISYFTLIAALGISTYGIREASKVREDRVVLSKLSEDLISLNIISVIVSCILLALCIICVPKLNQYKELLIIYSATFVFSSIGIEWLYGALEEYEYIAVRSIVFQFLAIILIFLFVRNQKDYLQYAGICVFSSVGSNIFNLVHSRRFISRIPHYRPQVLKHIQPVMLLFAVAFAVNVYMLLDTVILGFLKGDVSVGLYSAANKLVKLLVTMISTINVVMLPRLSVYAEEKTEERYLELLKKSVNFILFLSVPMSFGLYALSQPLIFLFSGPNYLSAVPVMQILCPVVVFGSLSSLIIWQVLMPNREDFIILFSVIASCVVSIFLNIFLVPKYSIVGSAISLLCTECFLFITLFFVRKKYLWSSFTKIYQYVISSCVMFLLVVYVNKYISSPILQVVVGTGLGCVVYFALLFLFKNRYFLDILSLSRQKFIKSH